MKLNFKFSSSVTAAQQPHVGIGYYTGQHRYRLPAQQKFQLDPKRHSGRSLPRLLL